MPKKKTIEEVRADFNQRDFTLVSKEYKGAHSILDYVCSNGHNSKISFNTLQKGIGCSECSGNKRKTIKEVRELFTARGFTLLSAEYNNNSSPLDYICDQGHLSQIRFNNLMNGNGCLDCSGKKTKTIKEVRQLFESRGFELLSTEYNNNKSPLNYICDQGHQTNICFSSLQKGAGCLDCSGNKKKIIEEVRQLFESRNFQLISDNYSNNKSILNYICDKGHEGRIRFNDFNTGYGCASCAEHGFNPNKSATLYYIRFQYEGNFYYKIGITNNTISSRFQSEKTSYTVLKETGYSVGKDARDKEQAILKEFAKFRYKGKPFLVQGNTELFSRDVLQLDDSILKAGRM